MPLSTWPGTILPIRVELQVGGVWTDYTSRVRLDREIAITGRGRANEQATTTPATCNFTLNNRDGLFNNRNPSSPLYGKIPRNLPVRVSVTEDRSFMVILDKNTTTAELRTADKASLRVTGDLDLRIEVDVQNRAVGANATILASRYLSTGNLRSWAWYINTQGYITLFWTTDGTTATSRVITSTQPVSLSGPIALRATLQVNNGSGGVTMNFYTSDTISGTWTQLGNAVASTGTSSIFAGTADLEVGKYSNGTDILSGVGQLYGRVYGFEMRSGINGTVVANAAIYNQARGTTTWSDGLTSPNTWNVGTGAEITPDDRRFTGELSAIPIVWDTSGKDVYVNVEAADVTRRLSKGAVNANSTMTQYFGSFIAGSTTPVTGYWPMEDPQGVATIANKVARGLPGRYVDCNFSNPADLPGSAGALTLNSTSSRVFLNSRTVASTGSVVLNFAMKLGTTPAATFSVIECYLSGSTIYRVAVGVSASAYIITAVDADGTVLGTANATYGSASAIPTNWNIFRMQLTQSGGNIQADLGWYNPAEGSLFGLTPPIFPGTLGRIYQTVLTGTTNTQGAQFSQVWVSQFSLNNTTYAYTRAGSAYNGETAAARFARVGQQNGIPAFSLGNSAKSEQMGPQTIMTPLQILQDCADTEGAMMYADRNSLALVMRTRRSLINQSNQVTVDYKNNDLGPELPTYADDDSLLRNSVTASRADGATGFAYQDSGPNSINSPIGTPPGVGVVPAAITRNAYQSNRLDTLASYDVMLGTWDDVRWPTVGVSLERINFTGSVAKISRAHNIARLEIGDRLDMTRPPSAFLPPDTVTMLVQGMREVLGNRTWRITWNTTPYGPFLGNDLLPATATRGRQRAAATNSLTTGSFNTTATSFTVSTPTNSTLWGTTTNRPGNFPMNIVVAGEVMTCSGISGTTSPQTFTISARSVNGVVKSHVAGESVQVQDVFPALM